MSKILEQILEQFDDESFLKADGFDDAIIGVDQASMRLIYSIDKCIKLLIEDGMSEEDAIEYFEYNVAGAYVGEQTPIFMIDGWEVG